MGVQVQRRTESTLPGLKYPTGRDDHILKTGTKWLQGKRHDDGAEGLWRIGDKLYDLEEWAKSHPGGSEWITLTKGVDITEAFEAHHVTLVAERMLPKFFVRDAVGPRASPFTFKPDGFYRKFKARVREALKGVDFHRPSMISKLIADSFFVTSIALVLTAAITQSWIAIIPSGIMLSYTTVVGHNFLHQRDSFRMYYMDLALTSSREWRITHALSHHMYTNTLLDIEITLFEPYFSLLPGPNKGPLMRSLSRLYSPIVYIFLLFEQGLKRIYSTLWESNGLDIRDAVPFLVPGLMCLVSPPVTAFLVWLKVMVIASVHFAFIGLNAAHHHPDIFHDGDAHREDMDWGLAEVDAVRDRVEIETSLVLVLSHFGTHTLHHLLPAVDHAYLHLCEPALVETCKEFDVNMDLWTQWDLVKGQWRQLVNSTPKKTPSIREKLS